MTEPLRWAIILSAHNYDVAFCPTKQLSNADGLSRLPVEPDTVEKPTITEASLFQMTQIALLPVKPDDVRQANPQDPILAKVLQYTQKGWPVSVSEAELQPYFHYNTELSIKECVTVFVSVSQLLSFVKETKVEQVDC